MEVPNAVDPAGGVSLLFTTALEIFSGIESAAQFSEIDEVLRVKAEVEKVRLIIWGHQPGPTAPSNKVPERRPISMLRPKPALEMFNPIDAVAPATPALQAPAAETKQATATLMPETLPERLPIREGPPYDNTGALVIQKIASAAQIPTFLLWQVGVEESGQPAPKPEPNVMDRIHIPSDLLPWSQRLLEVDPEGDPRYPGWAPASVSLEGLSREYQFMRIQEVDDPDTPPKKWSHDGRQVDALLSFAEKMKWPYLAEARKTLNDFVQQGTPVDIRTWDWVAGMALPGSMFPLTLMFGLHQACPSLNMTAPAGTVQLRHANFGMVFN
ncbi:hypothetical protein V501_07206 [Pseudogymnoascus sp. VKM F-4519 (FW-2642)]|nr:hypothetical protein V501_07206 [Pseudogymnoascus sp. VKM F-4519 (FW-2642)]